MHVIAVYSEKGGVAKTTSTIGLAGAFASTGRSVGVVDLDPQATASKWFDVEPKEAGLHVGAILADEEPVGWAADLAVPASWDQPPGITVIPSDQKLSLRERAAVAEDNVEGRLRMALEGWDRDVVLLDVPNRQGGALVGNALAAASTVVIPVTLDEDGLDGVERTAANVARFKRSPWNPAVSIAGLITCRVPPTILTKDARRVLEELDELEGLPVLGAVTERVIVREARAARDWWGAYIGTDPRDPARAVSDAYSAVAEKLAPALAR